LENRGVSNARVNFGIVRGLDYYSGMVFEVFDRNSGLGALAGGGRYDSLTGAFGRPDLGAAGVAGGIERIVLTMDGQGVWPQTRQDRVAVLYVNDKVRGVAASVASGLRLHGIRTDMDLAGRPLRKQMELASESKYAVIIAPKELEAGEAVLRNMKDGTESRVKIEKITDDPRSVLT